MRLIHEACSRFSELFFVSKLTGLANRPIEVGLLKRVAEAGSQLIQHLGASIKGDRSANRGRYRPKFIDPMTMISVRVRDDHGIDRTDARVQQLLTKIGTAVHEYARAGAFHEN